MSKEIKIGVLGLCRGMSYVEQFAQDDTFEIVALCDHNPEHLNWGREKNLVPEEALFLRFDEFLEYGKKAGMTAVFLANYFHEHAPFCMRVMEAGMAALTECIPAVTLKEACDLVRCVEQTGGKYLFAENYPFMLQNMELTRLCKEGVLGEVMYLEGEYNHHDAPAVLYDRSQGHFHWRNWEPRVYYLTHALAPLMMMSDGCPRYVSAFAASSEMNRTDYSFRAVSDGMAMMLAKFDNGAVARFTGCNSLASHSHFYRVCGDRGSAEWGSTDQVHLEFRDWTKPEGYEENSYYDPDPDKLDPRFRDGLSAGHGGSDYMVVQEIKDYLLKGIQPYFDVYRAASMAATAALALRSCLDHGKTYRIPDFHNPEEWAEYENDDLTPFYTDDGRGGTIRPCEDFDPAKIDRVGVFPGKN